MRLYSTSKSQIVLPMSDYLMTASCEGVLMKNLETYMQQGVATSPMTIGAPCNADLPTVEGCATTLKEWLWGAPWEALCAR